MDITAERTNWEDEQSKLIWLPHKKTYEFAIKFCRNKTVLDVGCGQGWGTSLISKYSRKITGLDIDKKTIEFADKKFKKKNLEYKKQYLEDLTSKGYKNVNIVLCFQVIDHLEKPELMLLKIKQIIKNKGILLLSVQNRINEHIPSPYHIREYSQKELENLLKKYFKKVKSYGLYDRKKLSVLIEKRRKLNNLIKNINVFDFVNLLPLNLRSKIFALGSKMVGFLVRNWKKDEYVHISTRDYVIKEVVSERASDIIIVCSN